MKKLFALIVLTLTWLPTAQAAAPANCTMSGTDVVFPTTSGSLCILAPDEYKITLFDAYLCTASPTAPTASATLDSSNCTKVYSNSTGLAISILDSGSTALTGGTTQVPAIGTYTHAVVKVDNAFKIKSNFKFSTDRDGSGNYIKGLDNNRGQYCATRNVAMVTGSEATTTCGSSAPTAGELTMYMTNFDGSGFAATSTLNFTDGSTMTGYLLDANDKLSTSATNTRNLLAVVNFAASKSLTINTTKMDISFGKSTGSGLIAGTPGGSEVAVMTGIGPFKVKVSLE